MRRRTQFQRALLLRRDAIREINVYFATNRNKIGNASRVTFGGDRADELSVGYASVWISEPSASATARAPSSAGSRPSASPDETTAVTRLVIKNVTKTTDEELVRAAAPQVRSSARYPGRALIFVHGFNVSFDNALFRAAQIAYDLNFDGPVFLFSWPSRGEAGALGSVLAIRHYPYDRESADEAVQFRRLPQGRRRQGGRDKDRSDRAQHGQQADAGGAGAAAERYCGETGCSRSVRL